MDKPQEKSAKENQATEADMLFMSSTMPTSDMSSVELRKHMQQYLNELMLLSDESGQY